MLILASNIFCTLALFILLTIARCAQEGPGASSPFPKDTSNKEDNLIPLEALQLTKGEWKRSIENKSKIGPPMPEQAVQQNCEAVPTNLMDVKPASTTANRERQDIAEGTDKKSAKTKKCINLVRDEKIGRNIIYVTSTSTIDCLPFTTTISPSCSPLTKCPPRPIAIVTEIVTLTEAVPENITHFHEILVTKTCIVHSTHIQEHHKTVSHYTTATTTKTLSLCVRETITHHTTISTFKPCEECPVTLTSTRLSIIRTPQSSTLTEAPICTTIPLEPCDCQCLNEPKVKKIIVRLPKCKRDCGRIPWWMKNLTPKYDPEKGLAYKKQIYEEKSDKESKCTAPQPSPPPSSSDASLRKEETEATCKDSACAVKCPK